MLLSSIILKVIHGFLTSCLRGNCLYSIHSMRSNVNPAKDISVPLKTLIRPRKTALDLQDKRLCPREVPPSPQKFSKSAIKE